MDTAQMVKVLKALAHPQRFRMIQEISAAGEVSCGKLGEKFPLAQPTMSHHIKILTDSGVINVRRDGQHGLISLNHELLDGLLGELPPSLGLGKRRARR